MSPDDVAVEVTLSASGVGPERLVVISGQPGIYVTPSVDDAGAMTLHVHACDLATDPAELVETLRTFADTIELAAEHGL